MKRPLKKNNNLTHTEILLLRSYAIGMGKGGVQDLLNINDKDYEKIEESLFRKLHVNNAYYAVMTAFRKKLVSAKEFCPEKIKAAALAFAHKASMQNYSKVKTIQQKTWQLYDLLLSFEAQMVTIHYSQQTLDKKIPTEAGK